MKKNWIISILIISLFPLFSHAQLLKEGFENYQSQDGFTQRWEVNSIVSLDTSMVRTGSKSLRIENSTKVIHLIPLKKPGKLEFSVQSQGTGSWNIIVEISRSPSFNDPEAWETLEKFPVDITGSSNFSTKTTLINTLDRIFLRFNIEKSGSGFLFMDDLMLEEISQEAEDIINSQIQEEKLRKQREEHFKRLRTSEKYLDASELVKSYQSTYQDRIKTLSMLYEKSNIVKIVSGTASALGDLNQLSNPTIYEKFNNITSEVLPKLDPIEKAHYEDQVDNKLENFFKKIENPLNIITGFVDTMTGGGIGVVVDSFKGLITTAFSAVRLNSLGYKRKDLEEEQKKGVKLYKEAQAFFSVIEQQNQKAIKLNEGIFEIYQHSKRLNQEILQLYIEYLGQASIVTTEEELVEVTKNQQYDFFQEQVNDHFRNLLGAKNNFDKNRISGHARQMDVYFQKIENHIAEYDRLSNSLNSFFSDFKNAVDTSCPFENVTEQDREMWERETSGILKTLGDVESSFSESFINVNFKK